MESYPDEWSTVPENQPQPDILVSSVDDPDTERQGAPIMKPIKDIADDLSEGRTTSRELVEQSLSKIEDASGEGQRTFIKVHADAARAAADAHDMLRAAGIVASPIAGLPFSVKDLFDVAGDITTAGSTILKNIPPATKDAPAVARLRAAGGIVIGRTNMTEFAYSGLGINPHYGTAKNPWDRQTGRIPGGSSAGAAVSVTDEMASFALGSDTGGSIRIPSSYCGLTGFKPTTKRVPATAAYPLVPTLDTAGPLAPMVSCCAVIDAIIAGEDPVAPTALPLAGLRLAVPQTLVLDKLDDHVAACFSTTLSKLSKAGAKIIEISFSELGEIPKINAGGGIYAEAYVAHRNQIEDYADEYDPRVRGRLIRTKGISAVDYLVAMEARDALIHEANKVTAAFDAVIMPTIPTVAPSIKSLEDDEDLYIATNMLTLRNTFCFNFLDRCALSIPMHPAGEGPAGLMVVGETMGDKKLLSVGLAIEDALAS
jgi:aspartyl-tRNA(Asn)/glutamyl-tRNA(Gln) amidotransferase subunit A